MLLLSLLLFSGFALCDTAADCAKDQILGNWTLHIGAPSEVDINCLDKTDFGTTSSLHITLENPNIARSEYGDTGTWTMIDSEGFSIYLKKLHYFALYKYDEVIDPETNKTVFINNCNETRGGWSNQDEVNPKIFSCFYGQKDPSPSYLQQTSINQRSVTYKQQKQSIDNLRYRTNSVYNKVVPPPTPVPSDPSVILTFPLSVDWSNQSNYGYASQVTNQGRCGSCYAYGTTGMIESRLSIALNRTVDIKLSVQDIVSCSSYTQGCYGGYGSTTSQWIRDRGIVSYNCFPYQQSQTSDPQAKCESKLCTASDEDIDRHTFYAENIHYVGGFFGNCSEEAMIRELQKGPITISIFTSPEDGTFDKYTSGIYDHDYPELLNDDHLVLLVGYGQEDQVDPDTNETKTIKYWKLRNSWGQGWGEDGFMRMVRGKNLFNIESGAEAADPYIPSDLYWPDQQRTKDKKQAKLLIGVIIGLGALSVILLVCTIVQCVYYCVRRRTKKDLGYKEIGSDN